jgi:acyl-CoA reductase-like NAD-dependent aldehyde dehydrogenase
MYGWPPARQVRDKSPIDLPVIGYSMGMATRTKTHELDAGQRNAMSESTFAFPRVRKEPLNDARHVRNAIARFDQVRDVSDTERDEAFRRIRKAAEKYGVEMTETRWQDLGKPSAGRRSSEKDRSKAQLYAEAKKKGIAGRSTMTREQLIHALSK